MVEKVEKMVNFRGQKTGSKMVKKRQFPLKILF